MTGGYADSCQVAGTDVAYRCIDFQSNRSRWDQWLQDAANAGAPQISAHLNSFLSYGAQVSLHIVEDSSGRLLAGGGLAAWKVPGFGAEFGVGIGAPAGDVRWWLPLLRGISHWCEQRKWLCLELGPHVTAANEDARLAISEAGFCRSRLFAPVECISADLRVPLHGKSDEDLLKSFRRQTRQHVLRSLKQGYRLWLPAAEHDLTAGVQFLHATAIENGTSLGALNRLLATVLDLVNSGTGYLALVQHDSQSLAGGVFVRAGRAHRCYRLATKRQGTETRAAYFLHWRAILQARDEQADWYYLTGRSTPSVYQFKRGFRPEEFDLLGAHRLTFRPRLMYTVETVRPLAIRTARSILGVVDRFRTPNN